MTKSNSQHHPDALLDKLLQQALPEPGLPDNLQQHILQQAAIQSSSDYGSLAERVLHFLLGDNAGWIRPAAAGLVTLVVGVVIGLSNPTMELDEELEGTQWITLNATYEVHNEPF